MSEQITITHERTDDIPVIIAFLLKMRVAELIDQHFPTNGNWTGLRDRKSTRLNSSHLVISYAVFCLKKKTPVEHPPAIHVPGEVHRCPPAPAAGQDRPVPDDGLREQRHPGRVHGANLLR